MFKIAVFILNNGNVKLGRECYKQVNFVYFHKGINYRELLIASCLNTLGLSDFYVFIIQLFYHSNSNWSVDWRKKTFMVCHISSVFFVCFLIIKTDFLKVLYPQKLVDSFINTRFSTFFKVKLACYHFATMHYSNVHSFLQIYPLIRK